MGHREAPLVIALSGLMIVPAATALGTAGDLAPLVHAHGVPLVGDAAGYRSVTLQPMVLTGDGNLTDCGTSAGGALATAACDGVARVRLEVPLDAAGHTMTPFRWSSSVVQQASTKPESICGPCGCPGTGECSGLNQESVSRGNQQSGDSFSQCGWGVRAQDGNTYCSLGVAAGSTWTKLIIYFCDSGCSSNSADFTTGSVHNYPGTTSAHNAWWFQDFVVGVAQGGSDCGNSDLHDHTVDSPDDFISNDHSCTNDLRGVWGVGMYWH